jgi:TPR repeat protein
LYFAFAKAGQEQALRTSSKIRASLVLAFLLLAPPGMAWSDFKKGLMAYESGDYKTAYEQWRPEANKGDPYAQHMLGFLYANGHGVSLEAAQTIIWWQRAAAQGFAPAQYTLGSLYRKGLGVKRDLGKATNLISRAADAGYPDAQYDYGVMHVTGEGVKQDLSTAYMWLDLAANTRGLEPGTFWQNIDKLLTPLQRLEADQLKKTWNN